MTEHEQLGKRVERLEILLARCVGIMEGLIIAVPLGPHVKAKVKKLLTICAQEIGQEALSDKEYDDTRIADQLLHHRSGTAG